MALLSGIAGYSLLVDAYVRDPARHARPIRRRQTGFPHGEFSVWPGACDRERSAAQDNRCSRPQRVSMCLFPRARGVCWVRSCTNARLTVTLHSERQFAPTFTRAVLRAGDCTGMNHGLPRRFFTRRTYSDPHPIRHSSFLASVAADLMLACSADGGGMGSGD